MAAKGFREVMILLERQRVTGSAATIAVGTNGQAARTHFRGSRPGGPRRHCDQNAATRGGSRLPRGRVDMYVKTRFAADVCRNRAARLDMADASVTPIFGGETGEGPQRT